LFTFWSGGIIDIERPKIDCLSFVMCLLLAQLKTGFFSIFFAAAVYSSNEANKAGLKQSIFLDVYGWHASAVSLPQLTTFLSS
jgi:hypothetical protein